MDRVRFLSKIVLAVSVSLALALTCSCSSDINSGPTYYVSVYGIRNCTAVSTILSNLTTPYANASAREVRAAWSEIRLYGDFLESTNNLSESEARQLLLERDMSPKEIDEFVTDLKQRGNSLLVVQPKPGTIASYYCAAISYVERE